MVAPKRRAESSPGRAGGLGVSEELEVGQGGLSSWEGRVKALRAETVAPGED